MSGNDIQSVQHTFRPADIATALGLLTRLPLPAGLFSAHAARPAACAAWAYPLVGLVVAGAAIAVVAVFAALGLPPVIQALFALLAMTAVTGALHEDGLADCADGMWGGWTRERRLAIMKDSQIGTYGVIALALSLMLRWQLIAMLIDADAFAAAITGAAVISRAAMVWNMSHLPQARTKGLSHQTGIPPRPAVIVAVLIGVIAALVSAAALATVVCVPLIAFVAGRIAQSKIGGQTGDVLGATQQLTEIAVLLALSASLN